MRFNKGDKVKFLNDVGGGVVVEILDARTYLVRNPEGFEIPTAEGEMILDLPMEKAMEGALPLPQAREEDNTAAAAAAPKEAAKPRVQIPLREGKRDGLGLYVGFQPEDELDPVAGPFRVHIINASPYSCYATLGRMQGAVVTTLFAGKVEAHSARQVKVVEVHELEEYRKLLLQVLYYSNTPCQLPSPESVELSVTPARFSRPGSFQENAFLPCSLLLIAVRDTQREALLHSLVAERVEQAKEEKERASQPPKVKRAEHKEEVVIDLHMHALTDRDDKAVSAQDILAYQLRCFEHTMDEALANLEVKRVVAIHGVGNGRLRSEVVRELKRKYPMCEYQDASFKEYGYGATMVLLRRKGEK